MYGQSESAKRNKGILRKNPDLKQRSASINVESALNAEDVIPDSPSNTTPTSKKHACFRHQQGVWRPGEEDEADIHDAKPSVADPSEGERVSRRLVQQRSLDASYFSSLYCDPPVDEPIDSLALLTSNCHLSGSSRSSTERGVQDAERSSEPDVVKLHFESPLKKPGRSMRYRHAMERITVRDILANRVPTVDSEDEEEEDKETEEEEEEEAGEREKQPNN